MQSSRMALKLQLMDDDIVSLRTTIQTLEAEVAQKGDDLKAAEEKYKAANDANYNSVLSMQQEIAEKEQQVARLVS